MRVNEETRHQKTGECYVFDDSFEHEVSDMFYFYIGVIYSL